MERELKKVKAGQRDLSGMRFGRLVCLEPTVERGSAGQVIWLCRCDCGNECRAVGSQLTKGMKKSCGCFSHPPRKNLVGMRFGRLTVIEYIGKKDGMHRWKCLCDCGCETVVGQTLLQSGKTKSCGCLQAEIYKDNLKLIDGTSITALESKKKLAKNNKSGHTGVYRVTKTGKWNAQIRFKSKTYHLGSFDTYEDAVRARERGEEMHNEFLEQYYSNIANEK